MNSLFPIRAAKVAAVVVAAWLVGYVGFWEWGVCRVTVAPGESLLLRYKGPFPFAFRATPAPDGTLVKLDASSRPEHVGILEVMPGPGRHFYSPLEFERELVPDIVIEPGKIGIVTAKMGRSLPPGTFLVDREGDRGVLRKVLTPGRYRLNKYAFDVRIADADACVGTKARSKQREGDPTLIPPGYVGVVTNKTGNPMTGEVQGIQDDVLQPGIYYLNPEEKRVDIISVGFNETTQMVQSKDGPGGNRLGQSGMGGGGGTEVPGMMGRPQDGASAAGGGQPGHRGLAGGIGMDPGYVPNTGIEFPSSDGFPIHLDYTAIWGILPDQAPDVVRQFGTLQDVEQKVILPQIGSICRLHGSKRGAADLLSGDTREEFQTDTSEELERVLESKKLTLLFGLTRHIYVPNQVREPMQKGRIADELTKTREQEQLTAKAQADLTEAKAKVVLEGRRTKAETEKLIAQVAAEGEKKAKEIEATTERARAEIDARTAIVQAQITRALGEANAKTTELSNQAEGERYRQYVRTLGSPDAYNRYVFAEGLTKELGVTVIHSGVGTFWTDLKGFDQAMLGKIARDSTMPAVAPVVTRPASR